MMRKKRRNGKCTLKQTKIISTRLIQISMRLEDYVYKNKPISAADAAAYIEEITTYKLLCNDERALQVIEKLTRCMNSIISEQQDDCYAANAYSTNTDSPFTCAQNTCASPVYSLTEEDRTFFTQELVADIGNGKASTNAVETIDLCDDETAIHFQRDVDIHRAISNLSIGDVNPLQTTPAACSQSLLDNYQVNCTDKLKGVTCMPGEQMSNNINSSDGNINNIKLTNPVGKGALEDTPKPACTKIETSTFRGRKTTISDSNTARTTNTKITLDKSSNVSAQNGKFKSQKNTNKSEKDIQIKTLKCNRKRKSKDNTENKNKTLNKDKDNKAQNKSGKEKTLSKKPVNKPIKICKENTVTSQSKETKLNTIESNYNKNAIVITSSKSSSVVRSDTVAKIYNKYVENDLSWMENIRYVREIEPEEFDKNMEEFDDNFWYSYNLPKHWDDQDFNA